MSVILSQVLSFLLFPKERKISTQVYFRFGNRVWICKKQKHAYLSKIVLLYYYLWHIGLPIPGFISSGVKQEEYCSSLQLGAVIISVSVSSCSITTLHSFTFFRQMCSCMLYRLCCLCFILAESWLFTKWGFIWGLLANGRGTRVVYLTGTDLEWLLSGQACFWKSKRGMSVSFCRFKAAAMKHYTDRSMNRV